MTRRGFLFAGMAAAALRVDALDTLEQASLTTDKDPEATAGDEDYWRQVRKAFDIEKDFLFLNHGGICPSPVRVEDAVERGLRTADRAPSYWVYRRQERELEEVRKRLAKLFKCDPEELAIMPNATAGLQTVIMGHPAQSGDRVVTTSQDYPRVLTGLSQRERRDGVRVSRVSVTAVPKSPGELVQPILDAMAQKPSMVAVPRIGYLNGTLFPVSQLAGRGVPILVDGAHGIGQLDEGAPDLKCDYYACCLHKWILGPLGSGFLYVKKSRIRDLWPLYPADSSLDGDIRKFEQFGTRPTAILLAIREALDCHEAIGTRRKEARLRYLRSYWTSKLVDHPKVSFQSSLDPALSRALTTVQIGKIEPEPLASWLFDKKRIFVTSVRHADMKGIRVSPNVFTSLTELDRLVAALREAVDHGIS
ncbi:MAG: aminotransferase class V-fold PLP-dependent enzyme [Fimbriimonadales bacterium]